MVFLSGLISEVHCTKNAPPINQYRLLTPLFICHCIKAIYFYPFTYVYKLTSIKDPG